MYFYVIATVAALGGLLFGYDTGVISGALLFIRQVMALSPTLHVRCSLGVSSDANENLNKESEDATAATR